MTTSETYLILAREGTPTTQGGVARAYCGAAHGTTWPVEAGTTPADRIDLMVDAGQVTYRLVQGPRTRRPATDHHGNYLYMPIPE